MKGKTKGGEEGRRGEGKEGRCRKEEGRRRGGRREEEGKRRRRKREGDKGGYKQMVFQVMLTS